MSVRSSLTCGTKSYFRESDADDAVDASLLCHYGAVPYENCRRAESAGMGDEAGLLFRNIGSHIVSSILCLNSSCSVSY